MAKKFISFLGTNSYVPVYYSNPVNSEQRSEEALKFVQEACIGFLCQDWTEEDAVLVFLTDEAKKKNWQDGNGEEGLKTRLEKLKANKNLALQIIGVENIREARTEDEIWETFECVFNKLEEGDEVIFDITHAFRSIPMLALVLLNYAKFLKSTKTAGIYYGAFEVLGLGFQLKEKPVEDRGVAPIVDLTPLALIQEWTSAANEFLNYGSASSLHDLTSELSLRLGAVNNREAVSNLRQLAKHLKSFTEYLQTSRLLSIYEGKTTQHAVDNMNKLGGISINMPLLKPILDKVQGELKKFEAGKMVKNGFLAVDWCIQTGLVQQGYTILRENTITFFCEKYGLDTVEYHVREKIMGNLMSCIAANRPRDKWEIGTLDGLNLEELVGKLQTDEQLKDVGAHFLNLGNYRNDINHAGIRKNPGAASKLKEKLIEINEGIKNGLLASSNK